MNVAVFIKRKDCHTVERMGQGRRVYTDVQFHLYLFSLYNWKLSLSFLICKTGSTWPGWQGW